MKKIVQSPLNLGKPARIKNNSKVNKTVNSGRQAQPLEAPEESCNTVPTLIIVNCNLNDSGGGAGIKKYGKFYFEFCGLFRKQKLIICTTYF